MANSNTLDAVIPQILAQGLMALREMAVLPALVNTDYGQDARQKGATIDVPIPSAIAVNAVAPGPTPPDSAGVVPTSVPIALDKWYEAPFFMSDKDMKEAMDGTVPMQATEAVRALANQVHNDIFAVYPGIYGYVGTAGTTPFTSDVAAASEARVVLNNQLCPPDSRRAVINPDAEGKALLLNAFQNVEFGVTADDIREGKMARKFGFDWAMSQLVPSHTAGTAAGATTNNAGYAVGIKTVTLASAGTGTLLTGDVFTFANHTQTYTVVTGDSDVSNGGTLVFEPGLTTALPTSAIAITVKATHVVNLAMHRDAIALATRPLEDEDFAGLGSRIMSAVDPVSGLTLRLEVRREHKRLRWSYDILYGTALVRPELACRIAG